MHTQSKAGSGVSPAALKPALSALARIIRGKITLPVLGMVKVEACPANQVLSLSATDLNLSLRVEVPSLSVIEQRDAFLIQTEDLQRVVKTAAHPQGGVDLGALRADEEVENFPEEPHLAQVTTIQLGAGELEHLFHAFTCVSEDETRYVLCGVCLDPADGGKMVATDGRHLVVFDAPTLAALKQPYILPDHRLWSWRGFRESSECTLHLGTFGKKSDDSPGFHMEGEGWAITGKCVGGNYPTYRQVIPAESQFRTRVELGPEGRATLVEKLEQLAKWKNTPAAVGLRIERDELHLLHREKSDQAFLETIVSTARINGPDITVMLNREYLIKPLRFGFTRMDLIDACSPVKFSGDSGLVIVMPIRCEGPVPVRATETKNTEPSRSPLASPSEFPDQVRTEEREPKRTMRTTNHNGNRHADGNGSRASTTNYNPEEGITPSDPVDTALLQLADTKEALKQALASLSGLTTTLKEVRQQQRDTEREIKTVRSTIRSLKELKL